MRSGLRNLVAFGVLFTAAFALAWRLQIAEQGKERWRPATVPLPARVLRVASLGSYRFLADMYYLTAIQYSATAASNLIEERQRLLYPYLDAMSHLDPYFEIGNRNGALMLMTSYWEDRVREAACFLERPAHYEQGVAATFMLGFVRFYYLGQFKEAADAMGQAAAKPGIDPAAKVFFEGYKARLLSQSGAPDLAKQTLEKMRRSQTDPELRKRLDERIALADTEIILQRMQAAVNEYKTRFGRVTRDFQDLMAEKLIPPQLPPLENGRWVIHSDGTVDCEGCQRFRLWQTTKGRLHDTARTITCLPDPNWAAGEVPPT